MTNYALIPGLLSDEMVWQALAGRLSCAKTRVYQADLRQHQSITAMAQSVLDATQGPLVAIGHSMGGRVAMEIARLAPQRITGLVLANTGYQPQREGEAKKRREMIELGYKSLHELADTWLPAMVDPARADDPQLMARLKAMVLRASAGQNERQLKALIDRPDAGSYLHELRCPILLITGRQDTWSPIAQHQEIAAATSDSVLKIIDNAGHFAPVEQPLAVTEAILDWLKSISHRL